MVTSILLQGVRGLAPLSFSIFNISRVPDKQFRVFQGCFFLEKFADPDIPTELSRTPEIQFDKNWINKQHDVVFLFVGFL